MTISAFEICIVLFFALGLRIGWTGQILTLLAASLIASLCALYFVRWTDTHYFLHLLLAALAFDAAIQIGFIIGLFTATHPSSVPLIRARRKAADAHKVALATESLDDEGHTPS